jgi:membrane associated rhomboid family serine protease
MMPIGDDNSARRTTPVVTMALIVVNVIAFLFEAMQPNAEAFIRTWGNIPAELMRGEDLETLFTSMFLHGGWAHLFGNMLFLWTFGDNVEDAFGRGPYLLFYLACGLAAAFAQAFLTPNSGIPAVGASGAISGVMAAYIVKFGTNRVRVLMGYNVVSVPAFLMIGLWILFQFINGYAALADTQQTGGIAYGAHIGGFLAGLALAIMLRSGVGIGRRRVATR